MKKTEILQPTDANIAFAAQKLKAGGLVAFPTETVYALGAAATDAEAVKKVFEVKGRPFDRALIVAVAQKSQIQTVVKSIPPKAEKLIRKFMPGALTLLLDRADCIPDVVTAGGDSVAVRIPDNDIALKLIRLAGMPVVVPSANTTDKPSPTLASHVMDDLNGRIDCILDGGASRIGIESTIVDTRTEPPKILRVGGVTVEQIQSVIGKVVVERQPQCSRNNSYIPKAEVQFSAYYDGMEQNIISRYDYLASHGVSAVILCLDGHEALYGDRKVYTVGKDYTEYAHNLFAMLRKADDELVETVIAEGVDSHGIGESLVARLIKLSGGLII